MTTSLGLFLLSAAAISLSGVMLPGPLTAVTIAKGYRNQNAGSLIALGHAIIEIPLMALVYFGFAQLLTGDADRPALHLPVGDGQRLVRFDVGPQADPVLVEVPLIAVQIVLKSVQIHDQDGRVEIFYPHDRLLSQKEIGVGYAPARVLSMFVTG